MYAACRIVAHPRRLCLANRGTRRMLKMTYMARLVRDHTTGHVERTLVKRKRKQAVENHAGRIARRRWPLPLPRRIGLWLLVAALCAAGLVWWASRLRGSRGGSLARQSAERQVPDRSAPANSPRAAAVPDAAEGAASQRPPETASDGTGASGPANDLGQRMPRNARELVMSRQHFDETVWRDEVTAQKYEQTIVKLWDALNQLQDPYGALRDVALERLVLNSQPTEREIDWGIRIRTFAAPQRTINAADWPNVLRDFQERGFRIHGTEWKHLAFDVPRGGQPARSLVSVLMHVEHPPSSRRFMITSDLKIQWATAPGRGQDGTDATKGTFIPAAAGTIEATNIRVVYRPGQPPFREQMVKEYEQDATGRRFPSTIHPIILHDLDDDGLPEVVVGGYNLVYWNQGDWKFRPAPICSSPAPNPNAGLFADFTGDGVTDYFCAIKSGFPHLFPGVLRTASFRRRRRSCASPPRSCCLRPA